MERPERVAFIGLGIMGRPMAENLLRAGFEVVAYNRTTERAEELAAEFEGASAAASPAEAAEAAGGVAISMVPDVPEVEAVLLGEQGAAAGLGEGGLAIDMSTIAPAASRLVGERLAAQGIDFLDAPVTGSRPKAEDGTLTIMAGGPEAAFERAQPLFEAMGELLVHVGPQGHGSTVKLINNTLAAVNAAALAEGLALAEGSGVDLGKAMEVVASGSGESTMRALKSQPMIDHDYEPLFKLAHMLKDVRYFLDESRSMELGARVAGTAAELYTEAAESGHADDDFAAVADVARSRKSP